MESSGTTLSLSEQKIVCKTFRLLKDDLEKVGMIAFMKSFETLPNLKDRFDIFSKISFNDLSQSHALRTHSKKVMGIIEQYVAGLEEGNVTRVNEKLVQLGERHHVYRAQKSDFKLIETQFINAAKPIMIKEMSRMKRVELMELSSEFCSILGDGHFNRDAEIYVFDAAYPDLVELYELFNLVESSWHRVFFNIRSKMEQGMEAFGKRRAAK